MLTYLDEFTSANTDRFNPRNEHYFPFKNIFLLLLLNFKRKKNNCNNSRLVKDQRTQSCRHDTNVSILVTSIQTWGRLVLSIDMEHITLNSTTTYFNVFGLTYC